jgi:preprotein translocase subunit SecA
MLKRIIRAVGGDPHQKQIQEFSEIADQINALEDEFERLSSEDLSAKTNHFRRRLAKGETLDQLLPEAYATVREASKNTIGQRHYDVQLIGGIAMHQGIVAEMRTGEGKTLTATLPIYLNALSLNPVWEQRARQTWGDDPDQWEFTPIDGSPVGSGVHLITVNDYLARRDARWMAPIYELLGMSIGVLQMAARTEHGRKAFIVDLEKSSPHEDQDQLEMVLRADAYGADITYGTNNEFGFDYLRDNMKMTLAERVQRGHHFAIIDEVDNVLIDEARTPLIISGPSHEDSDNYTRMAHVVKQLKPEDYEIDERNRSISLTEIGETRAEQVLGIALRDPERPEDITPEQARWLGYLQQALTAEYIYKRNKDYVVQGRKVIIVDHFTGRLMPGRRWSDGLHQAVEAKEGVPIESENVTYATITIQNYFRMYEKLAGMTGTAVTEAEEFNTIYSLDALAIPTHLDYEAGREDTIYVTLQERDEYNYKYTFYAYKDDPAFEEVFWKRKDYPDVIYRTEGAKLRAVVQEIMTYHILGRPILVGTTSVELSERISERLQGISVRKLVQTLIIRDAWFEKTGTVEDGRQIAALMPLNVPLNTLKTPDMRKVIQSEALDITLTPSDEPNLIRLLRVLGLSEEHKERLIAVLQSGIPHQVLNARKHTEESQIIAGAGAFGGLTIATNMAGRGVDIKLGGELAEEVLSNVNRVLRRNGHDNSFDMSMEERRTALQALSADDFGIYGGEIEYFLQHMDEKERVRTLGGLHVIGSERHEARRIDNQLRGRAARQGDPGSSRFYLSLEDELMVRFGGQQMESMLARLNVDEALPITNQLVSRIVEQSQTRVEGANFDVRKHLLEYDDVLNTQREKIYSQRDRILSKEDLNEDVTGMLREEVLRRVPESLDDEEGPWKLLSWLEQIQPTVSMGEQIVASYTLKLLMDSIYAELSVSDRSAIAGDAAQGALLNLARRSIQFEEEHLLKSVDALLANNKLSMENQIDERMETLDIFIEGLDLSDETDTRSSQQISQELVEALRLPLQISPDVARSIKDDPYEMGDKLRQLVRDAMQAMAITRLIGAVERVLKMSLELNPQDLLGKDWDQLADQILGAIQSIYSDRLTNQIGSEDSPGQISKDLAANISRLGSGALSEHNNLELLLQMPVGRRQTFDKKTHKRVFRQTTRLTYIHAAARALEDRAPEEITDDVLAHLENAQAAIHQEWGRSQLQSLGKIPMAELEYSTRSGLEDALGTDVFDQVQQQAVDTLEESTQEQVTDELGRQALTKIYRELLLHVISNLWIEYLTQMEALRVAIGLEAYAQRDPLVQYKTRAFEMFQNLLLEMRMSMVTRMFTFRPTSDVSNVQMGTQKANVPEPKEVEQGDQSKKKKRRRRRK